MSWLSIRPVPRVAKSTLCTSRPGSAYCRYWCGAAGDGAAEYEGEDQQEHDRLQAEAEQVVDVGPDLQQAAPGKGDRVAESRSAGAGAGRQRPAIGPPAGWRSWSCTCPFALTAQVEFGLYLGSLSARSPVRARKTSSRLLLRSANSSSTIPASSRLRTIPGSADAVGDRGSQRVAAGSMTGVAPICRSITMVASSS